jgi:hypothetical protein
MVIDIKRVVAYGVNWEGGWLRFLWCWQFSKWRSRCWLHSCSLYENPMNYVLTMCVLFCIHVIFQLKSLFKICAGQNTSMASITNSLPHFHPLCVLIKWMNHLFTCISWSKQSIVHGKQTNKKDNISPSLHMVHPLPNSCWTLSSSVTVSEVVEPLRNVWVPGVPRTWSE